MRRRTTALLSLGLLAPLAALATLEAAVPAAAAPAAGTPAAFTAQARAAGLTAAQAGSVQAKVDSYLATMGGTQVAPNRIQLQGATVTVTVPGEAHPRDLTAGRAAAVDHCLAYADYHHMCAYRGTYYTGDEIDMYACKRYYVSTWAGAGSWDNNQTTGTRAYMYGPTGAFVYRTPPAHSYDPTGNWSPVHSIVNC